MELETEEPAAFRRIVKSRGVSPSLQKLTPGGTHMRPGTAWWHVASRTGEN
jgi:hypothetical protein